MNVWSREVLVWLRRLKSSKKKIDFKYFYFKVLISIYFLLGLVLDFCVFVLVKFLVTVGKFFFE